MTIIGLALLLIGSFLTVTWFPTRRQMLQSGTWPSQASVGAYLWLAIYLALVVAGVALLNQGG